MKHSALHTIIFCLLVILPTTAGAQVACPNPTIGSNNGLFDPNAQLPSGYGSGSNSFGGTNFSGVGGALAGCLNAGKQSVTKLVSLFNGNSSSGNTAQSQCIADYTDQKNQELKKCDALIGIQKTACTNPIELRYATLLRSCATKQTSTTNNSSSVTQQNVPVSDINAKKSAEELAKINIRDQCLNGAAYGLAKNTLQGLTNKTINWAKTGYNGNPFYVRDMESYLQSMSNDTISTFLRDVPNRDPIFGIALRSVLTEQVTGFSDGRIAKFANTPEAQNYQAFQNDFTRGGWDAFLNPRNNALGAYFNAVDTISTQTSTAEQNTREELIQGNGFLSMKRCAEYEADIGPTAPNGTTDRTSCLADYTTKKAAELKNCDALTSIQKTACVNPIETKYRTLSSSCSSLPNFADRTKSKCLRYETLTPGQVISSQVSAVVNSPVNQLIAADSINEVLGGFFDSYMNKLFSGGLGSLGSRGNTTNTRGANIVRDSNGNPLPGVAETLALNGTGIQNSCSQGYSGDFDISRPQQLRAIIQTQKNYFSTISDNAVAISEIVPYLGKLDHCIPGPNPTWESGLQDNFDSFKSSFRTQTDTTAIGGAILGSVLGSNTTISWLANPSLFDKTTSLYQPIRTWRFNGDSTYQAGLVGLGATFSGQNDDSFFGFLNRGYSALIEDYKNAYTTQKIVAAFTNSVSTPTAKIEAAANINQSLEETAKLSNYAQVIPSYQTFYADSIVEKREQIAELEAINAEMLKIVDTAKTRYINERKAAGDPVDKACIDTAYVVNKLPIVAPPRAKSAPINPQDIITSSEASVYFYNNL